MNDHSFCRMSLATAREMMKEARLPIPKRLSTYNCGGHNPQFQIFTAAGDGPFITAHCAADAKAQYLCRLITRAEEARGRDFPDFHISTK